MSILNYLKYLTLFFVLMSLFSCSREEEFNEGYSDQVLQIKANLAASNLSTNTTWKDQDALRLFIKPSSAIGFSTLIENNRQFVFDESTNSFKVFGNAIYYPQSDTIDLIGYAPYTSGISNIYAIDVSDQSDLDKIDFLYSNSAKKLFKSNNAVPMEFNHQLSKIKFNIRLIDGNSSLLDSSKISLHGFYDKADFDLRSGSLTNQMVSTQPISLDTMRAAIIIPNSNLTNRKIAFSLNNTIWEYELPNTEIFEAAKQYEYTISISKKSVSFQLSNIVNWVNNGTVSQTEIVNSIPLEYVYIPPGIFQMGAPDTSVRSDNFEKPQHWVKISKGFFMSKNEITVAQYVEFLNDIGVVRYGSNNNDPIYHEIDGEIINLFKIDNANSPIYENNIWKVPTGAGNYPMNFVSYDGALSYAKWVGGTLPTEAQWEYAYRAGTKTKFFYGNLASQFLPFAWFYNFSTGNTTHPVGLKKPNPWGLNDIAGNVREWVLDQFAKESWYSANTEQTPEIDPLSKDANNFAVFRGGDFSSSGHYSSAYSRKFSSPAMMSKYVGFRVVINPN